MDVEQLKLILSAVKDVSGMAAWVAVLFALKGYFVGILGYGFGAFCVIKLCAIFGPLLSNVNISAKIRSRLNISGGYCLESEAKEIMELIELGLEAKKEKQASA